MIVEEAREVQEVKEVHAMTEEEEVKEVHVMIEVEESLGRRRNMDPEMTEAQEPEAKENLGRERNTEPKKIVPLDLKEMTRKELKDQDVIVMTEAMVTVRNQQSVVKQGPKSNLQALCSMQGRSINSI